MTGNIDKAYIVANIDMQEVIISVRIHFVFGKQIITSVITYFDTPHYGIFMTMAKI